MLLLIFCAEFENLIDATHLYEPHILLSSKVWSPEQQTDIELKWGRNALPALCGYTDIPSCRELRISLTFKIWSGVMTRWFEVKHKFPFKCNFGYFRAHKKVQWCERYKNISHWNYFVNFISTNREKTTENAQCQEWGSPQVFVTWQNVLMPVMNQ